MKLCLLIAVASFLLSWPFFLKQQNKSQRSYKKERKIQIISYILGSILFILSFLILLKDSLINFSFLLSEFIYWIISLDFYAIIFGVLLGSIFGKIFSRPYKYTQPNFLITGAFKIPLPKICIEWFLVIVLLILLPIINGNITALKTDFGEINLVSSIKTQAQALQVKLTEPHYFFKEKILVKKFDQIIEFLIKDGKIFNPNLEYNIAQNNAKCFYQQYIKPSNNLIKEIIDNKALDQQIIQWHIKHMTLALRELIFKVNHQPTTIQIITNPLLNTYLFHLYELSHLSKIPLSITKCDTPILFIEAKKSPILYYSLANLEWISGNTDNAIILLESVSTVKEKCSTIKIKKYQQLCQEIPTKFTQNTKLLSLLGQIFYYYENNAEKNLQLALKQLNLLEKKLIQLASKKKTDKNNITIINDLYKQYKASRDNMELNVAFFYAQVGRHELLAKAYAKKALQTPPEHHYELSTYAYIEYTFAARKNPPDFLAIEKAKIYFEKADKMNQSNSFRDKADKISTIHYLHVVNELLEKQFLYTK